MQIYNFNDSINNEELQKLIQSFYESLFFLNDIYPEFYKWFSKHIIGCFKGERTILYSKDDDIITGLIFLKRDVLESKICTLYIHPEYRGNNIANLLIEESFKFLKTDKPLFTFNKSKINMFEDIMNKYHWFIMDELVNYYKEGETEVILNRKLK